MTFAKTSYHSPKVYRKGTVLYRNKAPVTPLEEDSETVEGTKDVSVNSSKNNLESRDPLYFHVLTDLGHI